MDEAGNSLGACTFGMVGRLVPRVRSGKHSNENDGLALLVGRHAAPLLAASSCRRWWRAASAHRLVGRSAGCACWTPLGVRPSAAR